MVSAPIQPSIWQKMESTFFRRADLPPAAKRYFRPGVAAVLFVALFFPTLAAAQQEVVMFTAVDNAQQALLQKIRDEKVRLDIATWYLNDGEIMMAIANKFKSGVPVRVIGDRGAIFEADPHTRAQFEYLANAGVPIKLRYHPTWYPEIVHWKAGIFVGQNTVEFGSANWTTFELLPWSSTDFKDETAMFSSDSTLVRAFMTKFEDMWTDTATFLDWPQAYQLETGQPWKGTSPMTIPQGRLEPLYPTDLPEMVWEQGQKLADRMVQEIDRETSSVEIVIYRLSVPRIADALIRKKQAGVDVRVIVEPTQYRNTLYPEYEMTGAMMDRLWLAGIPIKIRLHQGLTHMKTLITSHVAMNGSSNFTAFWQRDHNYFIPAATKPALHQSMRDRFNIMWNDTVNFGDFTPQLPQEPTQLQPANGAFSVSTGPKLEWRRSRWATSFDVHLGTSPGNLVPVARVDADVSETPRETYSYTPSQALQPNTTYYWRVWSRTYATDVQANLTQPSEIWSFTTGSGPGGGGSGPYTGTPVPLPGTIQAENFDNGGAGVGYADTTSGNSGGVYRATDVDVEATLDAGGGYNVGWVTTGEWLKYSVSVTTAGTYDLEFRVASSGTGGTFHIESNGVNLTGPIAVPDTGGWQTWTTVKKTGVTLPAGPQIWTLVVDSATAGVVGNLNYIRVVAGTGGPTDPPPPPTTPYSGTAVALPGMVQAEAFDNGAQGQAYQDTTAGNSGGAFRTTNVDIEPASDTGGGHNVGWAVAGEWLQYTVNVGTAGSYDLEFRVASSGSGGTFHLEVNGTNVTGSVTVPNTGGWQTWATVKKAGVTLPAGTQTWRLVLDTNGPSGGVGNFNYINVVTAGATTPPPPPPAPEITIYAADIVAANLKGNWAHAVDATAAGGQVIASANLGAATVSAPLANPTNYVDVPFTAQAGVRYRFWLRMKALNNDKFNDSVYVQFSGAVDGGGSPRYRIGTTQGLNVNQATCGDCPPTGWGWQNRGYWEIDTGEIWFATSGAQTVRIQIREDGAAFDQIILSPQRFVDSAPGPPVNDATIVQK